MNNAFGNRNNPVSTFVFAPKLKLEMSAKIKTGPVCLTSPLHKKSGAFQKPIRCRIYHFWNRDVPARYVKNMVPDGAGSRVKKKAYQIQFQGAPIIDPV